jgi:hypothetical protein
LRLMEDKKNKKIGEKKWKKKNCDSTIKNWWGGNQRFSKEKKSVFVVTSKA